MTIPICRIKHLCFFDLMFHPKEPEKEKRRLLFELESGQHLIRIHIHLTKTG